MSALRQQSVGGETNEWYTPPSIFQALGLEFDLDPCSPVGGIPWVPAKRHYSYLDDGLAQPWDGRVWLNPPYGPHTVKWLAKLAEHGNGIALVFARTDVRWFQSLAPRADVLCLLRGRVQFVRGEGRGGTNGSAAPSCLLAFGADNAAAVIRSDLGLCYTLSGAREALRAASPGPEPEKQEATETVARSKGTYEPRPGWPS